MPDGRRPSEPARPRHPARCGGDCRLARGGGGRRASIWRPGGTSSTTSKPSGLSGGTWASRRSGRTAASSPRPWRSRCSLLRVLLRLDDQPPLIAGVAQDLEERPVVDAAVAGHREHAVEHRVEEASVAAARLGQHGRADVLAVDVDDPAGVAPRDGEHVAARVGEVSGVQEEAHGRPSEMSSPSVSRSSLVQPMGLRRTEGKGEPWREYMR